MKDREIQEVLIVVTIHSLQIVDLGSGNLLSKKIKIEMGIDYFSHNVNILKGFWAIDDIQDQTIRGDLTRYEVIDISDLKNIRKLKRNEIPEFLYCSNLSNFKVSGKKNVFFYHSNTLAFYQKSTKKISFSKLLKIEKDRFNRYPDFLKHLKKSGKILKLRQRNQMNVMNRKSMKNMKSINLKKVYRWGSIPVTSKYEKYLIVQVNRFKIQVYSHFDDFRKVQLIQIDFNFEKFLFGLKHLYFVSSVKSPIICIDIIDYLKKNTKLAENKKTKNPNPTLTKRAKL